MCGTWKAYEVFLRSAVLLCPMLCLCWAPFDCVAACCFSASAVVSAAVTCIPTNLQGVFDEDVARLYTAEIVAALSYLHDRGIVHR